MFWLPAVVFVTLICLRIFLRFGVKMCNSTETMIGKVVIVTGANSGIGFHVAEDLATRGARVILACRNNHRGTTAREKIVTSTGNNNVVYKNLNLSSLDSVRQFCKEINDTEERLDVLVNNAGVYGLGDRYTEDGIVEGMQINHYGPFLLTNLLMPLLKKSAPSRIVNVSSLIHYIGNVKVNNINKKDYYSSLMTYANSKFCNMVVTVQLAKKLKGSGVVVNGVHPGVINTKIIKDKTPQWLYLLFWCLCLVCYRTAREGAQTVIHLCVDKKCEEISGKFFVDCAQWIYSWKCNNPVIALNLWRVSEKLIGLKQEIGNKNSLIYSF